MQINQSLRNFIHELQGASVDVTLWGQAEVHLEDGTTRNLYDLPSRVDHCWKTVETLTTEDLDTTFEIVALITNLFEEAVLKKNQRNYITQLFARFREWTAAERRWLGHGDESYSQAEIWEQRKFTAPFRRGPEYPCINTPETEALNNYLKSKQYNVRPQPITLNTFQAFLSPANVCAETTLLGQCKMKTTGAFFYCSMNLGDLPKVLEELWFQSKPGQPEDREKDLVAVERILKRITALYQQAEAEIADRNWLTRKLHARKAMSWGKVEIEFWKKRFGIGVHRAPIIGDNRIVKLPKELLCHAFEFVISEAHNINTIEKVCKTWSNIGRACELWHSLVEPNEKYEACNLAEGEGCLLRQRYFRIFKNVGITKQISVRFLTQNVAPLRGFLDRATWGEDEGAYTHPYRSIIVNRRVITMFSSSSPEQYMRPYINIYDPIGNVTKEIRTLPEDPRRFIGPIQGFTNVIWTGCDFLEVDDRNKNLFWQRGWTDKLNLWDSRTGECIVSTLVEAALRHDIRPTTRDSNIVVRYSHNIEAQKRGYFHEVWDLSQHNCLGVFPVEGSAKIQGFSTHARYLQVDKNQNCITGYQLPYKPEDISTFQVNLEPRPSEIALQIINERRFIYYYLAADHASLNLYDMDGILIQSYRGFKTIGAYNNLIVAKEINSRTNKIKVIDIENGQTLNDIEIPEATYYTVMNTVEKPHLILFKDRLLIFKQTLSFGKRGADHLWIYDIQSGKEIANHEIGCIHLPTKNQYDSTTQIVMLQQVGDCYDFKFLNLRNGDFVGQMKMHVENVARRGYVQFHFRDWLLVDPTRGFQDPPFLHNFAAI